MTISYSTGFSEPYYSGAGVAANAGVSYPVSLGGVAYALDTEQTEFTHKSTPQLRAATDDQNNVGSQTLNPEAFWRRTFESWHVGAGQSHFDRRDESHPHRFRRSRGINVWDRFQVSLLNSAIAKAVTSETNVRLVVAGDHLYLTDGPDVKYTTDITASTPTWTTLTGSPAADAKSVASDGYNVLTAHDTSGIYKTTRGAASTASNITGTVDHVAYGKGRWIATNDNVLYDITTLVAGGGALPAAHFTHPNTDFAWNCFAEGPTAFYAGGYSGDKSLIYRLTMKEDGTGLNQPVVAGFLPDGELIQAMQGYLGFVLVGTSLGVRVGIVGGNGDLTIGALIPTDEPVLCFEGQDKFVWFGWSTFEGTNASGLGRLNLETFSDTEALVPAYASDLMVEQSAAFSTTSVVTFQGRRVWSSNGSTAGVVYMEDLDTLVASGEIDSGLFDYGLTDEKLSLFVDVSFVADGGSTTVGLSLDRGSFVDLATLTSANSPIGTGEARANEFEVRMTLARDGSDNSVGPVLRSWALRSQPATPVTEEIVVPLLIGPKLDQYGGFAEEVDAIAQVDNITDLCGSKRVTLYKEGIRSWTVIVADYQVIVRDVFYAQDEERGLAATCMARLKVVQ